MLPQGKNSHGQLFFNARFLTYVVTFFVVLKILIIVIILPLPKNIFFADITRVELVNLINQGRVDAGLAPLQENSKLNEAALLKAQDMVENNYFAHKSSQDIAPWFWFSKVNYEYEYAGENLAVGFTDSFYVYDAWFNSTSHRQNILNPKFEEFGHAVLPGFGPNAAILVVQLFASPKVSSETKGAVDLAVTNNDEPSSTTQNTAEMETVPATVEDKQVESGQAETLPGSDGNVLSGNYQPSLSKSYHQNSFYYRFRNFMVYDSQKFLNYIFYLLIVLALILTLATIRSNNRKLSRASVLRPLVMILVLLIASLINNSTIYELASHGLIA